MVFGASVIHPGSDEKKTPSVSAVCASIDTDFTRYVGRYNMNRKIRNEIIEKLDEIAADLLRRFEKKNQKLPSQIIFYRDGVAEGQFQHVVHDEVNALQLVFNRIYKKSPGPKLTFIVVQKRHHAW